MNGSSYPLRPRQRKWLDGESYLVFIAVVGGISGFIQGYMEMMSHMLITDNNFLEYITTDPQPFLSYYVMLYFYGIIFGAFVVHKISDSIGRRTTLIFSCALFSAVISWTASSDNEAAVLTSRLAAGIAVGMMVPTGLNYVAELSPPYARGRYCGILPLMSLAGATTALLVSEITQRHTDSWRICIAFPVMPALAMLLCLMFVPESPWWLLANRSPADGLLSLEQLRRPDEVPAEFNSMYRALSYDARQDNSFKALLYGDISLRYRLGLVCILQFVHAGCCERVYYEFGPDIIHAAAGGEMPWAFYMTTVGLVFALAYAGVIVGCINVDSVGRRYLLLLSLSCMASAACIAAWMVRVGHLDSVAVGGVAPLPSSGPKTQDPQSFTTYLTRYFYSGAVISFCFFSFLAPGVLVLHYIHKSVAGYRSLRLTGALWIVLAMVAALFGTYVFFALPETSGIVFEDADELFDVEDYDTTALCCPKGSGSGFVGFRSMSHGGARFKVYAPRARQTNVVGPSPQVGSNRGSLFPGNTSRGGGVGTGTRGGHNLFPQLHTGISGVPISQYAAIGSGPDGHHSDFISANSLDISSGSVTGSYIREHELHKYSTEMRSSGFQYVDDEDMISLHATPLFSELS